MTAAYVYVNCHLSSEAFVDQHGGHLTLQTNIIRPTTTNPSPSHASVSVRRQRYDVPLHPLTSGRQSAYRSRRLPTTVTTEERPTSSSYGMPQVLFGKPKTTRKRRTDSRCIDQQETQLTPGRGLNRPTAFDERHDRLALNRSVGVNAHA